MGLEGRVTPAEEVVLHWGGSEVEGERDRAGLVMHINKEG